MDDNGNVPRLMRDIVAAARQGDYGNASSLLNRCLQHMQAELGRGNADPAVLAQAAAHLNELLVAQQRSDWVAFADVLEYTFIDFWQNNFPAI